MISGINWNMTAPLFSRPVDEVLHIGIKVVFKSSDSLVLFINRVASNCSRALSFIKLRQREDTRFSSCS